MLRDEKKECVSSLEDLYGNSSAMVVVHYHGLSVGALTKLRRSLGAAGVGFQISKNTLSKIALKKSNLSHAASLFKGPTAVAYSTDPVAVAKGVVEFAKFNDSMKIVGGVVDGALLDSGAVSKLATLPSLEELRSQILGVIVSPATKLVSVLNEPAVSVARVISAYSEK